MSAGLRIIQGGGSPRPHRAGVDSDDQYTCARCEQDTGTATSMIMPATQSPMRRRGRMSGGTRVMVCVHCMVRGVVTVVA